MLRWLSNVDARVIYTEEAVEMWAHALAPFAADEVKQAILDHYRTNESVVASHAGVRKRALAVRDTRAAQQAAITAGPVRPEKTFADYERRMDRPEFQALMEQGSQQRRADLAARGLL